MRLRYLLALGGFVGGVSALLACGAATAFLGGAFLGGAFLGGAFLGGCSSSDSSGGGGSDGGTGSETGAQHDSGGNTDSGGGDSGGTTVSCDSYCTLIMQNCANANAEYTDLNTCKAMCANFAVGDAGEQSGNSLACRLAHAGLAAGNPAVHCRHAGPTGGGVCGTSTCTDWCELDRAQCPSVYASQSDCETACAGFAVVADAGDIALVTGNTFNCRIYHLEAAYSDPTTHCDHTAVVSARCKDPTPADGGSD
jgi:hypothetical protein